MILFILLTILIFLALLAARNDAAAHAYDREQARARSVICQVFGSRCREALNVAWCESRFRTWAHNGQYLGLFQMGSYARARYGHGPGAWEQARAARRYFLDAGWSPWECRP